MDVTGRGFDPKRVALRPGDLIATTQLGWTTLDYCFDLLSRISPYPYQIQWAIESRRSASNLLVVFVPPSTGLLAVIARLHHLLQQRTRLEPLAVGFMQNFLHLQ